MRGNSRPPSASGIAGCAFAPFNGMIGYAARLPLGVDALRVVALIHRARLGLEALGGASEEPQDPSDDGHYCGQGDA